METPPDHELIRVALLLEPSDLPVPFELRQGETVTDAAAFLTSLRRDLTEHYGIYARGLRNVHALYRLLSSTPA